MLYELLDVIFLSGPGDTAAIQNAERQILTYSELRIKVQRGVSFLEQNGIRAGDKLSCILHQSDDLITAMLACFCSGVTYIPISPDENPIKIQSILKECRPNFVLTMTKYSDLVPTDMKSKALDSEAVIAELSEIDVDIVTPSKPKLYPSETPIAIFYSSGTTGKPKGIPIKQSGMCYWLKCLQQFSVEKMTPQQNDLPHTAPISETKMVETAAQIQTKSGITSDLHEHEMYERPGDSTQTRVLMYISPSFDAHVWEFLLTMSRRGCCVIPKPETRTDLKALHHLIRINNITDILLLPPVLRSLIPEITKAPTNLQRLYSTGQELTETDVTDVTALGISLINCYGPTEATFGISMTECNTETCKNGKAAIAFPAKTGDLDLDGVEVILRPTSNGSKELYIVSPHLCNGYLYREEESRKSFVEIENEAGKKVRAFKTGDQFTSDSGHLYYEGRISSSAHLKINGQMIRLQDIEAKLRTYPYTQDVHVQSFDSEYTGKPVIYTYYTANQAQKNAILDEIRLISRGELRKIDSKTEGTTDLELHTVVDRKRALRLATHIMPTISANLFAAPDTTTIDLMINKILEHALHGDQIRQHLLANGLYAPALPEIIEELKYMPLTTNGKTNKALLAENALQQYISSHSKVAQLNTDDVIYTEMEQAILDVWRSIVPRIDTQTEIPRYISFQMLGGSSLDFTRMLKALTKKFHVPISCADFDDKEVTIATIANHIYQQKLDNTDNAVCLAKGKSTSSPIFLVHDITGNASATYQQLAKQLATRFPGKSIYALDARAIDDPLMRCNDLQIITDDYTQSIQKIQPKGPYIIMGWSAGATLAYMINRQLEQQKKSVSYLGLIDGLSPRVYQSITCKHLYEEIEVLLLKLGAQTEELGGPPATYFEREDKKGLINWIFQHTTPQLKCDAIAKSRLAITKTFLTGLMSVVIKGQITTNQPHVFSTAETTERLQRINPGMQDVGSLGWLAETQPITTWRNIGSNHIDIITTSAETLSSKVSQFFEQQQASGLTPDTSIPELTKKEEGITTGMSVVLQQMIPQDSALLPSLSVLLASVPPEKQGTALQRAMQSLMDT